MLQRVGGYYRNSGGKCDGRHTVLSGGAAGQRRKGKPAEDRERTVQQRLQISRQEDYNQSGARKYQKGRVVV